MADAEDIIDALAADAVEGVQRVQVANESVDLMSVDDRLKAAEAAAGNTAVAQPHFGIRMTRLIPPGCG